MKSPGFLAGLLLLLSTNAMSQNQVLATDVASGFDTPLFVSASNPAAFWGGGPTLASQLTSRIDRTLFVAEQVGRISIIDSGTGAIVNPLFLDITDRVLVSGESGLIGVAFHPQFSSNGRFFVHYISNTSPTQTIISEFNSTDNSRTEKRILAFNQTPYNNHKGGMMQFGPDGFLYIAVGEGGIPSEAQNVNSYLGKILRIDVNQAAGYSSPSTNPFFGATAGLDEIYAYGFRNPWRFSFDSVTGRLFCADVGQSTKEEVNIVTAGGNYGWPLVEGDVCYSPAEGCNRTGLSVPIFTYGHQEGRCSIIGGFVYRGPSIPWLFGKYVFGDFCTGEVWALEENAGSWFPSQIGKLDGRITSFGQDELGDLYACVIGDTTGKVVKLSDSVAATLDLSIELPQGARQKCRRNGTCFVRTNILIHGATGGDSNVRVFVSDDNVLDATDLLVSEFRTGDFRRKQVRKRKNVSFVLPAGVSGSGKYVIAVVDADRAVRETDELNNTAVVQIP